MALNVRKGANALLKIMTQLGVEVTVKTGGEIVKPTNKLQFQKVSETSYLMVDNADERVVLHNSKIFLNTLDEMQRHYKINFFG